MQSALRNYKMDMAILVLFLILAAILLAFFIFTPNDQVYCTQCHTTGEFNFSYAFGGLAELVAWLIFIAISMMVTWLALIPAVLISLWRFSSKKKICAQCGSQNIIPADSPVAIQNRSEHETIACPYCAEMIKPIKLSCLRVVNS